MVGGAYALKTHTGIWRDTKDLDLFLRKDQVGGALQVLARAGYRTELTDPLWLAKAFSGPYFIDLIFSSETASPSWTSTGCGAPPPGRCSIATP